MLRTRVAAVALLVIAGLLGMHGLTAGAAPSQKSAEGVLHAAGMRPHGASAAATTSVMPDCAMVHDLCTAVLPQQTHAESAALVVIHSAASPTETHDASLLATAASRGPPEVSLTGIGISRT